MFKFLEITTLKPNHAKNSTPLPNGSEAHKKWKNQNQILHLANVKDKIKVQFWEN